MKSTMLAVTNVDAAPYVKKLESHLRVLNAARTTRLALVKQFTSGHFNSRVNLIRPGELHAVRRLEGISHFLFFAAIPQSVSQIHEACERGKVRSKAKDALHATYSALRYGAKHERFTCVGKATNGESLWVRA